MDINQLTYSNQQPSLRSKEQVSPVANTAVANTAVANTAVANTAEGITAEEITYETKKSKVSSEELAQKVTEANEVLLSLKQGVSFSIDESSKSSVIKLIDKDTNEVIKQFPSEESLGMLSNIQEYLASVNESSLTGKEALTGSLINEKI
ncbi:MAG: hypothetical protein ISEC1_P0090 [Thiomicrorhabdus sp.]|nr:MAG: hypothetical protein ISEC1_P0090 [Thiomicrorhabdus sp.]